MAHILFLPYFCEEIEPGQIHSLFAGEMNHIKSLCLLLVLGFVVTTEANAFIRRKFISL